jgi:BirA family biotin operon repressor/biotin-[acetyl-CoA-carboxylase] ligase
VLDIERVRRELASRRIAWFRSIDSTMREAATMSHQGCPSGTVVVAEEQTAGQGRHGHTWHSEPESGLYVSIVLRLMLSPDALPALTLALGLATAEAIARATDLRCDLRWPNDVMIRDRKVAGILVQLIDDAAIAGIGINVNHTNFPPDVAAVATSLRVASGRAHERELLLVTLLRSVDSFCKMLLDGGKEPILKMFQQSSTYACGKRVRVEQAFEKIEGVTAGLDASGYLLVRKDDGNLATIVAGGVRPA